MTVSLIATCCLRAVISLLALDSLAPGQRAVSFPTRDDKLIYGDLYGSSKRAVLLAHGGRFDRQSWSKQAAVLVAHGFSALAIDYRGEGDSQAAAGKDSSDDDRYLDILAAIHYLRKNGAESVSVIGASMGGDYAAEAAQAEPDQIDRLVLLASGAYTALTTFKGPKLFIIARDDANAEGPRLPKILTQYAKALEPKELVVLEGSAHAQFLFDTQQGDRVVREILTFLSAR